MTLDRVTAATALNSSPTRASFASSPSAGAMQAAQGSGLGPANTPSVPPSSARATLPLGATIEVSQRTQLAGTLEAAQSDDLAHTFHLTWQPASAVPTAIRPGRQS